MRLQRIEVKRNGDYSSIRPEEFLALPLGERVAFILQRTIRFYGADGNEMPLQEGIRLLREHEADAATTAPQPAVPMPLNGNGKGRVSLSVFLQLPLDMRLPMLLERRVLFRDARGDAIPLKQALQIMHEIQDRGFVEATHGPICVETCA